MRVLVSNAPKTWLEFPIGTPQEVIDYKVSNYKRLMQEKEDAEKASLQRIADNINRKSRRYRPNGHEIQEYHMDVNRNTNRFSY